MSTSAEPTQAPVAETNPFAPPQAGDGMRPGRQDFPELSTKELKTLVNHSASITALACLWIIGAVAGFFIAAYHLVDEEGGFGPVFAAVFIVISLFQLVTSVGCFRRSTWGRVCGMIVSAMMLVNVPIGTIIGVLGLIAFSQGGKLFGPERLPPKAIKVEYRHRKKNGID